MEAIKKFERRLELKAENTRRNYRCAFRKFLKTNGLSEEELLELAEKDLEEVELLVIEAMRMEIDKGNKPTTARLTYKAVRFFLKANGFKNFSLDREDKPKAVYSGSRRTTDAHIRELWDSFSADYKTRNRAILMFLKDSGLRISDACNLNVEHYRAASEPAKGFRVFAPSATQKTGEIAHVHIGPEAVSALDDYLGDRETGPLFLDREGRRLKSKAMSEVFGKVKRCRGGLKEDYNSISAHSLRKFHNTLLPFRDEWIKFLEGKATDVYVDEPEVTQEYVKSYDKLRVFMHPEVSRQELEKLQRQLEEERRRGREELKREILREVLAELGRIEKTA